MSERSSDIAPGYGYREVTRRVLSAFTPRAKLPWVVGVLLSGAICAMMIVSLLWVLIGGVGVWGINIPTAWGFAITNFVWWIGIGHAGTLISAILLLVRQKWRNSINRFAEAMTLFAIMMAGMFPLLHLGRVSKFYYLFPYPNQRDVWPQWRSPLVWDVIAVSTYGIVSLVFWYLGLLPDIATVRDTARRAWVRGVAGVACFGWRGSAMQWERYQTLYFYLAALATPLVVSVHSIVSLDFSVGIVPGWHSTIFPPYFVAGAIFSGMAMVFTITIPLRKVLKLHDLVTTRHLDMMARVTLASAVIVGYGYVMEVFTEWYSAENSELIRMTHRFTGGGAWIFYTMIACNVVAPLALWSPKVRRSAIALFVLSLVFNLGMWLERYDIVIDSLTESTHMASAWGTFAGTFWDWSLLIGSLGTFVLLFLLFVRAAPIISIHEMRELVHEPEPDRGPRRVEVNGPARARTRARWLVARFASEEAVREAAGRAREAGVLGLDAFTPVHVHGLREKLGTHKTRLGWVVFGGAALGAIGAYALQWYAAVLAYPWNIGGRPLHSWPSFLPLTFELGVLGGTLAGLTGFIVACKFPRPYHPLSRLATFGRSGIDRFMLSVDLDEQAGEEQRRLARRVFGSLDAERVDEVNG